MSDIPTPETYNLAPWEFHHIPFRSAICPRCKGSGLDPDCTKKEISKGVRLSKSPATKWYVTDYPEEGSFAVTDGYEIFATISGGKTIGDECDLASRIAKLPDLERERDETTQERDGALALLALTEEFLAILGDELHETAMIATLHGWKSRRYEQGKILREKIKQLKEKSKLTK